MTISPHPTKPVVPTGEEHVYIDGTQEKEYVTIDGAQFYVCTSNWKDVFQPVVWRRGRLNRGDE